MSQPNPKLPLQEDLPAPVKIWDITLSLDEETKRELEASHAHLKRSERWNPLIIGFHPDDE